jgi:voltage-dependent anion channel protein 2
LINKDFYHISAAALEVKLKSPDGLTITTKGVSPHEEKKTDEKKHESQITGSVSRSWWWRF